MKRWPLYLFVSTAFLALEMALFALVDQPVSDWARALDQTHPDIINFFRAITDAGKSKWYLWPAGVGVVIALPLLPLSNFSPAMKNRLMRLMHQLIFFFSSVALSGIVTDIIKPILGRARPVEWERHQLYGLHPFTFHVASMNSMPSGHATTAAALAAVMSLLYPRGRILWWATGIFLAASRVMVNAHYVSDVLAGILVGILTTCCINCLRDRQGMFPQLSGIFPIDKKPPVL